MDNHLDEQERQGEIEYHSTIISGLGINNAELAKKLILNYPETDKKC